MSFLSACASSGGGGEEKAEAGEKTEKNPLAVNDTAQMEFVLFDGGFANPTPFDVIRNDADITIAVDVTGRPDLRRPVAAHSKEELWDGAFFALFAAIVREKEERHAPDILLRPDVGLYRTMDFPKMDEILARSAPEKARLKQFLVERVIGNAPAQGTSSTI